MLWKIYLGSRKIQLIFSKKQKQQLDTIVNQLNQIEKSIKQLSSHVDDKIDELGLDLREDRLREHLDYIDSRYLQYMPALKSINTNTKRSRDTMTARGTELALHIYDHVHAIQSALMDDEKPGLITRLHTPIWKQSSCLITYFVAMQRVYRKYGTAQIKGAFLITALNRDPLVPFADSGNLLDEIRKKMDAQISHIRTLTLPEYYDIAQHVLQDPFKEVPFKPHWAVAMSTEYMYPMTASNDIIT